MNPIKKWLEWLQKPERQFGAHFEGSRSSYTTRTEDGGLEVTVTIRDTQKPDEFGRETVYSMLKTVRENERRMGWVCPEPKE